MPYRMERRVISARKLGIRRGIAGSLKNGKRETPIRNLGGNSPNATSRPAISCYNCGKEGHISLECCGERRNQGRRENGRYGGGQIAEITKSMALMQEVLKKLAPGQFFPKELR